MSPEASVQEGTPEPAALSPRPASAMSMTSWFWVSEPNTVEDIYRLCAEDGS